MAFKKKNSELHSRSSFNGLLNLKLSNVSLRPSPKIRILPGSKLSQAAMEFLMTYGWAILAAIIAIGILAYSGVFNPGKYVKGAAVVNPPFYVDAWNAKETGVTLELRNNGGENYNIQSVEVSGCGTNNTVIPIVNGGLKNIFINCNLRGEKTFKGDITITYTKSGSSLGLSSTGTIAEKVTPSNCVYGDWVNQGCGGGCSANEMYLTRDMISGDPGICTDLSRCSIDIICTPFTTQITNCYELQNIKNDLAQNYYLMNDIDCSVTSSWNSGKGFEPIGSLSNKFTGSFNGQGYKIKGLYINRASADYVGLFAIIESTNEIKNTGLENFYIIGKNYVGSLIGNFISGIVSEVYSKEVTAYGYGGYGSYVGGLVGGSTGTISESYTTGSVTGSDFYIGGLVGKSEGIIRDSYSKASVTGYSQVGGLVGYLSGNSQLLDSYATGSVSGNNKIGGLIGETSGNANSISLTKNSFATGKVSGAGCCLGGLIGLNYGDVQNSYWNDHGGNPDVCIGDDQPYYGVSYCTTIYNNETYFYVASGNEPMIKWSFPPWSYANDYIDYPVLA